MDVGSNPTGSKFQRIRGRVVEGTGLIIHFRKNITGSNPVGCTYNFQRIELNFRFNLVAFPVKPRKK